MSAYASVADVQREAEGVESAFARFREWVQARALLIVAVSAVVLLSLAGIPLHFAQDSWLALVGGRLVAAHGIPQHDYFTQLAHGVRWIDQQWLAQLVMYELQRLGGIQLLTVIYVLITGAAFAGAVAAARTLGAQDLHVLAMLPVGAFFYLATAESIRTQGFAYPLFIVTLYLLATDVRAASPLRRTYLVLPLLALWANLHGSVTLGVGVCVIYAFVQALRNVRARGLGGALSARVLLFAGGAPLTLFITPYGGSMLHYYSSTLMNPEFGRLVTEWKPVTSVTLLAVPLFILIAAAIYVVGRTWRRTPLFDQLVLALLAAGAVLAVRNITWFGLAVIVMLPGAISRLKRDRPAPLRSARLNLALAVAMVALTAATAIFTLARPGRWFTSAYPRTATATLTRLLAADPRAKVFADVHYADWLIWQRPQLFSGRVAYDTSLELLSVRQLEAISEVGGGGRRGVELVDRYRIWVLNPTNHKANRVLLGQRGVHVVRRTKDVVIATYSGSAPV